MNRKLGNAAASICELSCYHPLTSMPTSHGLCITDAMYLWVIRRGIAAVCVWEGGQSTAAVSNQNKRIVQMLVQSWFDWSVQGTCLILVLSSWSEQYSGFGSWTGGKLWHSSKVCCMMNVSHVAEAWKTKGKWETNVTVFIVSAFTEAFCRKSALKRYQKFKSSSSIHLHCGVN